MNNNERLDAMRSERRAAFHGTTYKYATSSHGDQVIGVCLVTGDTWAVCWISESGARKRVKSARLPVMQRPDDLQSLFSTWAGQRGLAEAIR